MSTHGTKRTKRAGLMMSVVQGRPEVTDRLLNGAFDPATDIRQVVTAVPVVN
jgi:hypothetical protein